MKGDIFMKKLIPILLILSLCCSLFLNVTYAISENEESTFNEYQKFARGCYNLNEDDVNGLTQENFLGLSKKQMLEDYDYW